jgi:hypothetical protein
MGWLRAVALALFAVGGTGLAQEPAELERIELRVTSATSDGSVNVDRGSRDGLEVGDRVEFFPREGGPRPGTVREVSERAAVVGLLDPGAPLPPGTRGEVLIPRARLDALGAADPPQGAEGEQPDAADHPPWEAQDEEWKQGMPLLAQVGSVRPEERAPKLSGRVFFSGEQILADERSDTYLRLGTALQLENPFGRGGVLSLDGELLYRATNWPDESTDDGPDVRLDRASYAWGGNRFESTRWEVGRFLQYGMPEFGMLDGAEWRQRLPNGDSLGLSLGFMPEIDEDQGTGDDLQLAGSYQWLVDDAGRLRLEAGFQKTLHDSESDRDLLVAKASYLPDKGWDLRGTAWVDFYGSEDDAKDSSAEVTQAWLSTRRTWETGGLVELSYRHLAFPQLEREEFEPVLFDQLADDRYDRLALRTERALSSDRRGRAEAGAWVDEDDSGGDLELGLGLDDVLFERGRADVSLFGTVGRFLWLAGLRASVGQSGPKGSWELFYEIANSQQDDFASDLDDILQQRLGIRQDFTSIAGWNLSLHAVGMLWDDDELGLQVGLFLGRSF